MTQKPGSSHMMPCNILSFDDRMVQLVTTLQLQAMELLHLQWWLAQPLFPLEEVPMMVYCTPRQCHNHWLEVYPQDLGVYPMKLVSLWREMPPLNQCTINQQEHLTTRSVYSCRHNRLHLPSI